MPEPPASAEVCWRVLVSGRVQGVSFRWYAVEQARALGLKGWVRNLPDGRVEAWIQGPPAAVEPMLAWLARGPRRARVDALERHPETPGAYADFTVERGRRL